MTHIDRTHLFVFTWMLILTISVLLGVYTTSPGGRAQHPQYNTASKEAPMPVYTYYLKEYKVIDGDTVRCLLDRGFNEFKRIDVRIEGVNTPEARGSEREVGKAVSACLIKFMAQLDPSALRVTVTKKGKYAGRCVGDISDGETSVGAFLEGYGFCQEYGAPDFTDAELEGILEATENYLAD